MLAPGSFDAVLFDAGGVLVLPDPTVIGPLLAPLGGELDIAVHRRAHYAAMAAKSHAAAGEADWLVYNDEYVRRVGVAETHLDHAADLLQQTRTPMLWRWPIPDSAAALAALAAAGVPMGVVSNAAGQVEAELARAGICQVGDGPGAPMRVVVDSMVVGVAKPDPAIFDHALPHFDGITRDRIAYVGDSVTMDVGGATAACLHPILIDPFDDHTGLRADDVAVTRIASLAALVPLFTP